jgi:uncharacterized alpha/beta hydrolase family protein
LRFETNHIPLHSLSEKENEKALTKTVNEVGKKYRKNILPIETNHLPLHSAKRVANEVKKFLKI